MADDTTNPDDNLGPLLAQLGQYGAGAAGTVGANAVTQKAYEAILKNLHDRFGEYSNLPPAAYKQLSPQNLGPSALNGVQGDPQARLDEQNAIEQLDSISKAGGLDLGDKNALNQIEQTQSRNAGARNASLANQYAARGQLGSGQQLAMEMANNQHATENANQRGETIAAQAQKRAMEAVMNKGTMAHNLSNEDYARKAKAAEAADAIAKYNSGMSMDAQKGNNALAGDTFENQLKKLHGENDVTSNLDTALLGSGKANASTIGALGSGAGGLINSVAGATRGGKGGGGGSPGSTDTPTAGDGTTQDFNTNLQPDASDPGITDTGSAAGSWDSLQGLDEGEGYA